MSNPLAPFDRWTHTESGGRIDQALRHKIYSYFLQVLQKSHASMEEALKEKLRHDFETHLDIMKRSGTQHSDEWVRQEKKVFEERFLHEYLYRAASMEDLSAALGGVESQLVDMMDPEKDTWGCLWNDATEARMSEDVRFSFTVLHQAVERTYGKELEEIELLWAELGRKLASPTDNPLNLNKFLQCLYVTQINQGLQSPIQNMVFLELEQEILQSLGIVVFETRAMLEDFGVSIQSSHRVDQAILKRKHVFSSTDSEHQAVNDEALFNTLVDLLQTWEPSNVDDLLVASMSRKKPTGDHLRPLNNQEIFSAIATLQQWAPKVLEEALGQPDGRLGHHIKETLIKQAEALGVPSGEAKISEHDEQAVDLVDSVFTGNLYERQLQQAARTILAQILFPSVKAAILNRRWFAEDSHPARQFITSVTDTCAPKDGAIDVDAMERARHAVDKLVAGFNEDVSIFEILTHELQAFRVRQHVEDDTDIEQREADWRDRIGKELQARWKMWTAPPPLLAFAMQLGTDYLFELDKNSERSTMKWDTALGALDSLLHLRSKKHTKVKIDGALRDNLMKMLTHCGWTGVRAHNRLAEQEDIIHAYYAHGQTEFEDSIVDMQGLLNAEREPTSPTGTAATATEVHATQPPSGGTTPRTGGTSPSKIVVDKQTAVTDKTPPSLPQEQLQHDHISLLADNEDVPTIERKNSASPDVVLNTAVIPTGSSKDIGDISHIHTATTVDRTNLDLLDEQHDINVSPNALPPSSSSHLLPDAEAFNKDKQPEEQAKPESGENNSKPKEPTKYADGPSVASNRAAPSLSGHILSDNKKEPTPERIDVENLRSIVMLTDEDARDLMTLLGEEVAPAPSKSLNIPKEDVLEGLPEFVDPPREPAIASGNNGIASIASVGTFSYADTLQTIKDLQIGSLSTWVNAQEEMMVLRLSWISPISLKYLFVNNQGARSLMGTPKELVDMAQKGRFFPGAVPKA